MNAKRLIIGTIVGGIVLYILGYVIWTMLFADFFAANAGSATGVDRETELFWAVALGTLAYAALLTLALDTGAAPKTVMQGIKVGATVGFLLWFTADFILYGLQDVANLTATIVDPLLELVRGGITGAVIAAVLAKV